MLRAGATASGPDDPRSAVVGAGLRYCSDSEPGIRRARQGRGFTYRDSAGAAIRDRVTLERIHTIGIPPAWKDVWIAADPEAHIAATGRDARGRKQYRYHPDFVRLRDQAKFEHLVDFATGLPRIRRRIAKDIALRGLQRQRVLATICHLLDATGARVGNEQYARSNGSFGLTTLRNRHVTVRGKEIKFLFYGKSGKEWNIRVQSARVARIIRACQELPGQHLFAYRDENGDTRNVSSEDVNAYLREISGMDVSAKDFRTWSGTVEAAVFLASAEQSVPKRRAIREALEVAARRLKNTITVCRKCYVHPEILAGFETDALNLRIVGAKPAKGFTPEDWAVLRYLQRRTGRGIARCAKVVPARSGV